MAYKIKPVILCGGIGKRLRPLSRPTRAKQFISLFSILSPLQKTIKRVDNASLFSSPLFVTHTSQSKQVAEQAKEIQRDIRFSVLKETARKNTAPAIIATALSFKDADHPLLFLPSDHYIPNKKEFEETIQQGLALLNTDPSQIICFGIKPRSPHTGYGYIKKGNENNIRSFTEKPNKEVATRYVSSKEYLWNSGIFLCHPSAVIAEAMRHCPGLVSAISIDGKNNEINNEHASSLSFDIAIMEKTNNAKVIETDIIWSDIGSWKQLLVYFYNNLSKRCER